MCFKFNGFVACARVFSNVALIRTTHPHNDTSVCGPALKPLTLPLPLQQITTRDYHLQYLAGKGPALLKLLCRLTKLGWLDVPAHRDIVREVQPQPARGGARAG